MHDLPLHNVYFFLMERTQRQAKALTRQLFAELKIQLTLDQWIILKRIAEEEGISQKEVAATTFKEPAAVTRMLDILIRNDWVKKEANQADRRRYELYLTEGGRTLYRRILPLAIEIRRRGLNGVQPDELDQLKQTLNKIYSNLSEG